MDRLEQELKHLFGEQVAEDSKSINMAQFFAGVGSVSDNAARLASCRGKPQAQRAVVRGMNKKAAEALCQWIRIA